MLSILVQEIQTMKAQLGRFVADFGANQELAGGLVNISQGPCGICGHVSTYWPQDVDFEFNDDGSQLSQ